jgi:hypothetical protein
MVTIKNVKGIFNKNRVFATAALTFTCLTFYRSMEPKAFLKVAALSIISAGVNREVFAI